MGVLRVDEVCVVGVARVELGVVDAREDLLRRGAEGLGVVVIVISSSRGSLASLPPPGSLPRPSLG